MATLRRFLHVWAECGYVIISCPGRESGAGEVGLRQERSQWRCGEGRPATTVRGEIPGDRERFQESHANENLHELRTS